MSKNTKRLNNKSKTKKIILNGQNKNKKKNITYKVKKTDYTKDCYDMSGFEFNKFLRSKLLHKRVPDKFKQENNIKLLLNHRGSINAINSGKWNQQMRQNYKKIKDKFSMKPNSKEWIDFREKFKCNVFRNIESTKNTRVIGVLSIPTNTGATLGATSYIPQSYVKWAELHGARIVPIQYDLPIPIINGLLNQINGLLLIGGTIEGHVVEKNHYKFLSALKYIVKKITHFNLIGNHFPIFSICLGFELLPIIAMYEDVSDHSDCFINHKQISIFRDVGSAKMKFTKVSKEEEKSMLCDAPSKYFTKEEINNIENQDNVYMFHNKSFVMGEKYMKQYDKFLKVTGTTKKNGKDYVSMYQFLSLPFYGVQFHPEKIIYEWLQEGIPHNNEAIMFSKRLCEIFMFECDKNYNTNILAGNNDTNFFIENYDLLSRDNAIKILYPHDTTNINLSMMGASYYFGRTDNIKSEYLNVPRTTLEKSIKSNDEEKIAKLIEEQKKKEKILDEM
jgi:anthranilate/para-aminobenzoate synthase component II